MQAATRLALVPDTDELAHDEIAVSDDDATQRIRNGWRKGKPVEDPAKTKRWGIITAKPSEYLIHMRRGRILRKTTGQGASCFKWPWDSVAIIPTTINRLQFTADQVTLEKVGVQVTGLAVYRIVEPEITFRMLNFSYSERASQKLGEILCEMFVGATRRHIANLSVEDVMTRRKEAIATELLRELAPVMSGHGQVEDSTNSGWGVVLDTVEVQNVSILSERVFRDMQAEFRSRLAMRARQAELDSEQEIAAREAASRRAIEEARLTAEAATRELRAQAEIESERATQEEQSRLAALAREQTLAEAERQVLESRHQNMVREATMESELTMQRARNQMELRESESASHAIIQRRELEVQRVTGELEGMLARMRKEIDNTVSEDRIRMALVEQSLPAVAQAFSQQFAEARFTQIGGAGADPTTMIAGSIAQVLELARSLGLRLGGPADAGTGQQASQHARTPAGTRVEADVIVETTSPTSR